MSEVMKLESVGGRRRSQRRQRNASQRQQRRSSQRRGGRRQQQQRRQRKQQGGEQLQLQQGGDEPVGDGQGDNAGGVEQIAGTGVINGVNGFVNTAAKDVSALMGSIGKGAEKAVNIMTPTTGSPKKDDKPQKGGSAVDAGASNYQAGAPGYNSTTQVHNTFGGIGQQVGTNGAGGIIQPFTQQGSGSQMGGKRSQRRQRKSKKQN